MPVAFIVDLRLLATNEGGRVGPLPSGEWRTVLGVDGLYWSTRLEFSGTPKPGEKFRAIANLLMPKAEQHFPVGCEFTVWEGVTKAIGHVVAAA